MSLRHRRAYCRECSKFEFRQATEVEPTRPMTRVDWSLAIVVGGYFFVIAFLVANHA